MPIHPEDGGYQWGGHGKVYHGPDAKKKAEEQAAAAHAHGYKGDEKIPDTDKARSEKISQLRHEGYPEEQAIAIAYSESRKDSNTECAGILIIQDGKVFLVHRTDRDEWEGPGGHLDGNESALEAAERECIEEIGVLPRGITEKVDVNINNGIEYTTYKLETDDYFIPQLNHEHNDWGWFPINALPEKVHPNIKATLNSKSRKDADELNETDIAKMIRDGELPSPQRIGDLWLFDIRITGTGTSFREALNEYVYRPPEFYLNDDFLERCQGLPVIFEHPEKNMLNTEEYQNRTIGSIALPYIPERNDGIHQTDEVWGIARIYDGDAAELMMTSHISTSPGVALGDSGSSKSIKQDDGSTLLIEGKAQLLDHVGICRNGVWDKGDSPRGVAI